MKQYSTNNYITKEEFYQLNKEENFYTGFVVGLGYAFVEYVPITYLPKDLRINNFMSDIPIQRVDYSEESYVRSLNITSEQIKKLICTPNNDGTYDVAIDFLHHKVIGDLSELRVDMYEDAGTMKILIEVYGERYDVPLVDFNKRYGQLIRETIESIDLCNSFVGLGIDIFENKFWSNDKFKKRLSNDICSSLRRNRYKINASQIKKKYIPKAIGVGSRASSFIGVGCALGAIIVEKEVRVSDVYAVAVAGSAFIPCVGWALGGALFAADCISYLMSGKTIGDHLDSMFDDNGLILDLKEDIEIFNLSPNSLSLDDIDNIDYRNKNITPHYDEMEECIAPRDNTRVVNHFIKKW
jgi:hypothetical protein